MKVELEVKSKRKWREKRMMEMLKNNKRVRVNRRKKRKGIELCNIKMMRRKEVIKM